MASARQDYVMDDQPSSLPSMSDAFICEDADKSETIPLAEEVYLDHTTPVELRRLWDIRQKWIDRRGHSMWENIIRDYLGPVGADALGVDKRAQVKARLERQIHKGVLRHGVWPARNVSTIPSCTIASHRLIVHRPFQLLN